MEVTPFSHNNNISNGWNTHYLCLSAARRKLNHTNGKYIWNTPWYSFNSSTMKWNSPRLSLLCRRGCIQEPPLFLIGKCDEDKREFFLPFKVSLGSRKGTVLGEGTKQSHWSNKLDFGGVKRTCTRYGLCEYAPKGISGVCSYPCVLT